MQNNLLFIILLMLLGTPSLKAEDPTSAEDETRRVTGRLDLIMRDLPTMQVISSKNGIGDQTLESKKLFEKGAAFFAKREYLSAEREIQRYLNQLQTIDPVDYLQAQYILGACFEDQGLHTRALRAYLRYLNSFLTSSTKNFEQLTAVLRRIFELASAESSGKSRSQAALNRNETTKLMSALSSQEIPNKSKAEFYYLAAKLSASVGVNNLANQWIEKSGSSDENPVFNLRSRYYQALLILSFGDVKKAYDMFVDISDKMAKNSETATVEFNQDTVLLAMARAALKLKRPQTAVSHYEQIIAHERKDDSFQNALFESVYLLSSLGEYDLARKKARTFLSFFSGGKKAHQLKNIIVYLDLNAGDLTSAHDQLLTEMQDLESIKTKINQHFRPLAKVDYTDLIQLSTLTHNWVTQPAIVIQAQKLFADLEESRFQSFENKAAAKNLVYSIANNSLNNLNPQWGLTYDHLEQSSLEIMDSGSRLSAIQRTVFADYITEVDQAVIDHSSDRRIKLFKEKAVALRMKDSRAYLLKSIRLAVKYSELQIKLQTLLAKNANLNFLRQAKNPEYTEKLTHLADQTGVNLQELKKQDIRQKVAVEQFHGIKKLLTLYASNLKEESSAISSVEKNINTHMAKIQWDDLKLAWKKWEDATTLWLKTFNHFEKEIQKNLAQNLLAVDRFESDSLLIENDIENNEAALESVLGLNMATIADQYQFQVDEQLGNYKKWLADIEYMKFDRLGQDRDRLEKSKNLKLQILKEQLRDVEQGTL